jgi:hypothetical protein
MLKDKLEKDIVSPTVLSFLSDGWSYDISENVAERVFPDRNFGPKNISHSMKQKIQLETLKEIDILSLYIRNTDM